MNSLYYFVGTIALVFDIKQLRMKVKTSIHRSQGQSSQVSVFWAGRLTKIINSLELNVGIRFI